MNSIAALQAQELAQKRAERLQASQEPPFDDPRFVLLFRSCERMVRRICNGLEDDYKVGDDGLPGVDARMILPIDFVEAVAQQTGVSVAEMKSDRKTRRISNARHMVFYLLSRHTSLSLPAIGRQIGIRDHSSVIYGKAKAHEKFEKSPEYRAVIWRISEGLGV